MARRATNWVTRRIHPDARLLHPRHPRACRGGRDGAGDRVRPWRGPGARGPPRRSGCVRGPRRAPVGGPGCLRGGMRARAVQLAAMEAAARAEQERLTRDTDGDRLADVRDRCPSEPETYNAIDDDDGCPEATAAIEVVGNQIRIRAGFAVYFAPGREDLLAESEPVISGLARVLTSPQYTWIRRIRLDGHTDDTGEPAENLDLSEKRVRSVARELASRGVDRSRMELAYYGESRPIDWRTTEDARARNRRVEFIIIDPPHDRVGEKMRSGALLSFGFAVGVLSAPPGAARAQEARTATPSCEAIVGTVRIPDLDVTERRRAAAFCQRLLPALQGISLPSVASCVTGATSFQALGFCVERAVASGPERITPDVLCTAVAIAAPGGSVRDRHAQFDRCRGRVRELVGRATEEELLRCLRGVGTDASDCWSAIPVPQPRAAAEARTESGRRCLLYAPDVAAGQVQVVLYECGDATWPCNHRFDADIVGERPGLSSMCSSAASDRSLGEWGALGDHGPQLHRAGSYAFDQVGRIGARPVQALEGSTVQLRVDDGDGHGTLRTRILGATPTGLARYTSGMASWRSTRGRPWASRGVSSSC